MTTRSSDGIVVRRVFGGFFDDWVAFQARMMPASTLRQSAWLSVAVVAAVAFAHWFLRWPLADEAARTPSDVGFSPLQPVIWLGVAVLAAYALLRMDRRPRLHLLLALITVGAALVHVAAFVAAGIIGSFADSTVVDGPLDILRNLVHVLTFTVAAELSRAYLFTVWKKWNRDLAFAAVTLIFTVTTLTAAQHTPWDSLAELRTVVGGVWIPALAVSVVATALVEMGGPVVSLGYRLILLGFLWLWPSLPDLEWWALAAIGAAAPWVVWRLVNAVYRRTKEGKDDVGPPAKRPQSKFSRFVIGVVVMSAIVVGGLVLIFGTGFVGYRTQIVDDTAMEPSYESGDVVIVRTGVNPLTLDIDDVIIVRRGDETDLRRIVAIEGTQEDITFITKADAQIGPDPAIGPDQVEGEVIVRIPDLGHPVLDWRD
jgi:hypothetical protein